MRRLGGSTGAWLGTTPDGTQYVIKYGGCPEHVLEETYADACYRAMEVPVPDGGLHEGGRKPAKVSEFIPGPSFRKLLLNGDVRLGVVIEELRKGFAADALLANWDVIGVAYHNIILGEDGIVYRIDNGSALRRRNVGLLKSPWDWNGTVHELRTLREWWINPFSSLVFGYLADEEIAEQIMSYVIPNREDILAVVPDDLGETLDARIKYLTQWAESRLGD